MRGVPVLNYHALEQADRPAGSLDAGEGRYVLQVEKFDEQMAYLHREGFRALLFSELLALGKTPGRAVILTFDDGHASNLTLALPILQRYGFKAEFFITTDWLGTPRYLQPDGVRSLWAAGMGIGSHGASHAFLGELDEGAAERELRASRDLLSGLIGEEIVLLSAPGGRVRPGLSAIAARLGYRFLFTSRPGLVRPGEPGFFLPRMALRSDTDLGAFQCMVHGDADYLGKLRRRERLLSCAKKVLGGRGYQAVRKMILRMC